MCNRKCSKDLCLEHENKRKTIERIITAVRRGRVHVRRDLRTPMTAEMFDAVYARMMEEGWKPYEFRDKGCTCFVSAPCSSCCLDGDYHDEMAEELGIVVVSNPVAITMKGHE